MGKYKCIPKTVGVGLGTFLFQVALPALIFHSCGTMSFVGVNWWILVALFLGKALIFCCTIIIGTLSTSLETAAVWAIFVTQSNDFALGLPLLRSLYSTTHPNYPTYIFLAAPISLVILNPIGFVCMELGTLKRRNPQQRQNEANEANELNESNESNELNQKHSSTNNENHKSIASLIIKSICTTLKNPLVLSVICGLTYNVVFGGKMIDMIANPIILIGSAFDGVALFCLGLSVVGKLTKVSGRESVFPISMVLVKIILLPILCKLIVDAMPDNISENTNSSDLVFLLGMFPTAPGVFLYALRYGLPESSLAYATAVGTLLSAPLILLAAIMTEINVGGQEKDNYFDILALHIDISIGWISTTLCALMILPVCCSYLFQKCRNVWQLLSKYETTIVIFVLLLLVAHISLSVASSTCNIETIEYNLIRWFLIFGSVLLYRLSTLGLAIVIYVGKRKRNINTRENGFQSVQSSRSWYLIPIFVVVIIPVICTIIALTSQQGGHSPVHACLHPFVKGQDWTASCCNMLTAIACSIAVASGFATKTNTDDYTSVNDIDDHENESISPRSKLLLEEKIQNNLPEYDLRENEDLNEESEVEKSIALTARSLAISSSNTSRTSPRRKREDREEREHFTFLNSFRDSIRNNTLIEKVLPFFVWNALSAIVAVCTTFILMYSEDYQTGILRMILIIDDIALYGGGIVTVICFHDIFSVTYSWSMVIHWCKHQCCPRIEYVYNENERNMPTTGGMWNREDV